jgi:hypothetical protein
MVLGINQSFLSYKIAARTPLLPSRITAYKALGGGWQIRTGKDFVPEARQQQMRERTDWGELIPGDKLPEALPKPPPTGTAQPLFNKPEW